MSNFIFKGDTLYRLISSGGIDLFIPPDSVMGDTISRDTGRGIRSYGKLGPLIWRLTTHFVMVRHILL